MNNGNELYTGLIAPHWNEIDKIHYGPAEGLDPTDEILLGRYVLVKYTGYVYTQDRKDQMIYSNGEGLTDNDLIWYNCYISDGQDCDGVVFKKIFNKEENEVQYKPIAQLSTSYTINGVLERLGPEFTNNSELTVETYVAQQNESIIEETKALNAQLRGELVELDSQLEQLMKNYTDEQIQGAKVYSDDNLIEAKEYTDEKVSAVLGDVSDTFNTLYEIEQWIKGDGIDTIELTTAIEQEAKKRADSDIEINTKINEIENNVTENQESINILNKADVEINTQITNINEINTKQNNTLAQHTKDIANLSKIAVIDVTTLPAIEEAGVSIFYRLVEGTELQLWYIEVAEDGSRSWKKIGATVGILTWKEF